jgi:hypothetical protein
LKLGKPGAEQVGPGFFQCLATPARLGYPIPTPVGLHPDLGAEHLVAGLLQNGAHLALEYNQVGPERFHGFNGTDLGAVSHNFFIVLALVLVLGLFDYDYEEEAEDDFNWSMLL